MRSGILRVRGGFWFMSCVSSALTIVFVALTPGHNSQEVLALAFAGYTDATGLYTAVSFEIVVTIGYTIFQVASYGGRSHRGLHDLRRMKTGSARAITIRIVEREAICSFIYIGAIIGGAAAVLGCRFASQMPREALDAAISLLHLLIIGSLQVMLYVFVCVGIVLERASLRFALWGIAILVVAPPVGLRPDWLPLHQFDIPAAPGDPLLRSGALTVALLTAIATACLRPREDTLRKEHP